MALIVKDKEDGAYRGMDEKYQYFSKKMTLMGMLCAVMVVWIHVYNVGTYENPNAIVCWLEEFISHFVCDMAVPFFFMQSAFFLYSKERKIKDVYKSRTKSILIPYLLWNTIYLVAFGILHFLHLSNMGIDEITLRNIVGGVLLYKYNGVFWFMFALIILIILYPIIRLILKSGKYVCWVSVCLLLAFYLISEGRTYMRMYNGVLGVFIYYFIGAIMGRYFYNDVVEYGSIRNKKKMGLAAIFAVFAVGMFCVVNIAGFRNFDIIRNLCCVGSVFLLIDYVSIEIRGTWWTMSFMIYAIHRLVLESVEKLFYLFLPHSTVIMLLDYLCAPVITLALIYLICSVWKKILPQTYKILSGGR